MAVNRSKVQQKAEKLLTAGKLEHAVEQYRQLVSDNPRDLGTLNKIGDDGSLILISSYYDGSNEMRLHVFGNEDAGRVVVFAVYDNLGKGASGAAVQNLNLMIGADPRAGL